MGALKGTSVMQIGCIILKAFVAHLCTMNTKLSTILNIPLTYVKHGLIKPRSSERTCNSKISKYSLFLTLEVRPHQLLTSVFQVALEEVQDMSA